MPAISAQLCVGQGDVTDSRVRPGGEWVSAIVTDVSESGKSSRLVMWSRDGVRRDVLVDPEPASGYGLSGGVHCWSHDGKNAFVSLRAGGIVRVHVDTGEHMLLGFDTTKSWWCPTLNNDGDSLAAVSLWNEVCVAPTNGGAAKVVVHQSDFALDPVWWLNSVHWCAWSKPNMPWDFSEIRNSDGAVVSHPDAQVQQARVSPDGKLVGYLTDASGVLNLWTVNTRGERRHVVDDSCEHGEPTWGPGQRTWCWSPDSTRIAFTRNVDGYCTVNVVTIATGDVVPIGRAVHGCLDWNGDTMVAIRSGARTPPELVWFDMSTSETPKHVVFSAVAHRWQDDAVRSEMSEPEVRHVEGIPIRLYRARASTGSLVCWIHGGPTAQWQVTFMPRFVYWMSRGVDIAVIDHRGSTGHGRAFQQMLNGAWGRADVEDILTVARHAHSEWGYSPDHTAFMGGSAGGLTVLGALASEPGTAACAVVSYPVTDLALLARGDDPFESHCVPRLVGADRRGDSAYLDASPTSRPDRVARTPVLVFHGDKDTNVPIEQSYRLRDEVAKCGGEFTVEVMQGEGHGIRNRDNQLKEYEMTEAFLRRFLEMRE